MSGKFCVLDTCSNLQGIPLASGRDLLRLVGHGFWLPKLPWESCAVTLCLDCGGRPNILLVQLLAIRTRVLQAQERFSAFSAFMVLSPREGSLLDAGS